MGQETGNKPTTSLLYRAIGKSMLGRYAVFGVQLVTLPLLARLFTPEQFGIVGATNTFSAFFSLLSEAGVSPALINLDKISARSRDGIFGLTLVIAAIVSLGFLALGPAIEAFYGIDRVGEVVPYAAAALFFSAASIVPKAFLLRDQAFFRIAHAGLVAEIGSVGLVLLLLQWVDPVHALASKVATNTFANFVVSYALARRTEFGLPRPGRDFGAIRPLLSFSLYQWGFAFINYFSRNLDDILVGRELGPAALGVYEKAYRLMKYPLMILTFSMTPAIQPVIRKLAHEPLKVEAVHREFAIKMAYMGLLVGVGVTLTSKWIVLLVLGQQWVEVEPVIHTLALAIPVQMVLSTCGSFFQAMKRTDLLFATGLASAVMMVTAIVVGVAQRDLVLLSWYLVAAFYLSFLQTYYVMYGRIFGVAYRRLLAGLAIPATGVAVLITLAALGVV